MFQISGYEVTNVNRYIDSDVLCMIGKMSKNNDISKSNIQKDKPNEVQISLIDGTKKLKLIT